MATLPPPRFALDLSGTNIANLVEDEPHTLPAKKIRTAATIYGPYYTESLVVVDAADERVLIRDTDYVCLDLVPFPTVQTNKEICSNVVIINEAVSSQIRLTYQALGGAYERTYETTRYLLDALTKDDRPAMWPNIINRPLSFDPLAHLQNLSDMIGLEYLIAALENLRTAILLGDDVGHDELLTYIDTQIAALESTIDLSDNFTVTKALAAASDAKAAADDAIVEAQEVKTTMDTALQNANEALDIGTTLMENGQNAVDRAIALINQYGTSGSALNYQPTTVDPESIYLDGSVTADGTGLVDLDSYQIDNAGNVFPGVATQTYRTNPVLFDVVLRAYKRTSDDRAQINIRVKAYDYRSALDENTDVGGAGLYCSEARVTLYPLQFRDAVLEFPSETDAPRDLSSLYASTTSLALVYEGLTAQTYTKAGVARPTTDDVHYNVFGKEGAVYARLDEAAGLNADASKIGPYLIDCRADYNIDSYGAINRRRPISLILKAGSTLHINLFVTAPDVADVLKSIVLPIRCAVTGRNTVSWAYDEDLQKYVEEFTTVFTRPDSYAIRALCVNYIKPPQNATPATTPIYALTKNKTNVAEGSSIAFTLTTQNVPVGTQYEWTITGIQAEDVTGGLLTGTATIGASGSATVTVGIVADATTEGAETMTFSIAGKTTTATVNDTSKTPIYTLDANASSVNEGGSVTFTFTSLNVPTGVNYNWQITGVSAADISGGVTNGTITTDAGGNASVTVTLVEDLETEGAETLTFEIVGFGLTEVVTINDTSVTP